MSFPGIVSPGAIVASLVGFLPITNAPPRNIGGIVADVTVEEEQTDTLTITRKPVEQGAAITDNAYKEPARLVLHCGWSNSSRAAGGDPQYVQDVYDKLLALQVSRNPITIVTGKRRYKNMLIPSLSITTDQTTENALMMTATCEEVILVTTQVTSVPPQQDQLQPKKTAPIQTSGTMQLLPKTISALA